MATEAAGQPWRRGQSYYLYIVKLVKEEQFLRAIYNSNFYYPASELQIAVGLNKRFAGIAEAWACGISWQELVQRSGMDEGDLARLLRQTLDLVSQVSITSRPMSCISCDFVLASRWFVCIRVL